MAGLGKIAASLHDKSPEMLRAAGEGHHLAIGPGEALTSAWVKAGLSLPDLPAMRQYRLDRVTGQLKQMGYDGLIVLDPLNVRYVSDTTNMQIWVMHNGARYAYVSADGYVIVWEFDGCDFLSGHSHVVDEIRPAITPTFFISGPRYAEQAQRWGAELADVVAERAGSGARIAIDQATREGYHALEEAGIILGSGQEVMELARAIKGPDEIKAMRCAAHACQASMSEMLESLRPGMTEREIWAKLHGGNIKRAGEWIETQILASGPRTNPWFQEASSRVIDDGDIVAYDTDLVGAYGMMIDISRSWVAGDKAPTGHQRKLHGMAVDMMKQNAELLTPGRSFKELTFDSYYPPDDEFRHYSVLYHGVGQCDEYPGIYFPSSWDEFGYEGELEAGMVMTSESFVGSRSGGEGIKVEDQYLITEHGSELLTDFPLDLVPDQ